MKRTFSSLLSMVWLLVLPPLLAGNFAATDAGAESPRAEETRPVESDSLKQLEAEIADVRERLTGAKKRRDEALVQANIYVLPKDKVAAEEAQREIDSLEAELAKLEERLKNARR